MEKLQILRVDNDLVQKVDLQIGNNVIGRSVVTGCDDGEIIKHAVTINLSPDREMTITPVSPCYMKSTESSQWQLLKLGTTVPIKPGDICFLVPYKCWFKVILTRDIMEEVQGTPLKRKANEDVNCNMSKKPCSQSGEGDNLQCSNDLSSEMLSSNNDVFEVKGEIMNVEHLSHKNATDMAIQNFEEIHNTSSKDEDKKSELNSMVINESQKVNHSSSLEQLLMDASGHQSVNEKTTKVLAIEETLNSSKNLCPIDQDDKLVTPKDDKFLVSVKADEPNVSVDVTANTLRREKCIYGKKCYRRNPQHRDKFCHPGDSDYNIPDDREECPYGARCYRKNPQHRMQFKHTAISNTTKGANERRDRRKQTTRQIPSDGLSETEDLSAEESAEESVDESEYEPSSDVENSDDESEWEDDIID